MKMQATLACTSAQRVAERLFVQFHLSRRSKFISVEMQSPTQINAPRRYTAILSGECQFDAIMEIVMKEIRLDKALSELNLASRSDAKKQIKKGTVRINGILAKSPDQKIAEGDIISYSGDEIVYTTYVYYMLYKPAGCVSATNDRRYPTVMDYLDDQRTGIFPVGRLDLDTEGLLILTNDGALSHELLSPRSKVTKEYEVRLSKPATKDMIPLFSKGIDIGDDKPTAPAALTFAADEDATHVFVTVTEGRFHEIKRMFASFDNEVIYLKRLSMGGVILDQALHPGTYRPLTADEIRLLKGAKYVRE